MTKKTHEISYVVGPRASILLPEAYGLREPGQPISRADFTTDEQWDGHLKSQAIIPSGVKILLEGGSGIAIGNSKEDHMTDQSLKGKEVSRDLEAELEAFRARQAAQAIDEAAIKAAQAKEAADAAADAAMERLIAEEKARLAAQVAQEEADAVAEAEDGVEAELDASDEDLLDDDGDVPAYDDEV